mgnify:FL=1
MILSHPIRMKHPSNRRRHKRLCDFITLLAMSGLMAGCEANAKNEPSKPIHSTPEVAKLTADECAKITVQEDMIKCFENLKVQQNAEIAALDKDTEAEQEAIEIRRARIEKLSKKSDEAMKRLEERVLEPER